jgi:hypothetical protein
MDLPYKIDYFSSDAIEYCFKCKQQFKLNDLRLAKMIQVSQKFKNFFAEILHRSIYDSSQNDLTEKSLNGIINNVSSN